MWRKSGKCQSHASRAAAAPIFSLHAFQLFQMNILEFGFEMCFCEQALVVVVVEVAAAALCLRMSANDQTRQSPFSFCSGRERIEFNGNCIFTQRHQASCTSSGDL
jgi:hypothetical protein